MMIHRRSEPAPGDLPRRAARVAVSLMAAAMALLPLPSAAAPESFVRVSLSLPLRPLLDTLDRALPQGTLAKSDWEAVNDTVRMRWTAKRAPVATTPRRDTLLATSVVTYQVEARSGGLTVSCGAETPVTAVAGVLTRLGWREDWGLESRSGPLPTAHSERCKPKPPGVNFTEILAARLDSLIHPRLGSAFDSLVARDPRPRALAAGVWDALQTPFETRVSGLVLDFAPRRMVAATPLVAGDRLTAELVVVVAPRLLWNEPVTRKPAPLPANQVRIAGDRFELPFEVLAPFDSLRRQALDRCGIRAALTDAFRVEDVRLGREGGRLTVAVRTRGAGTLRLSGGVEYDPVAHTIGVTGLVPDAASERSARALPNGARALAALRECLAEGLRQDITDWLVVASAQAGRALNRDLAPGIRIEGGIFERRAERVDVEPNGIRAIMVVVGRARIVAEASE
jgi:hypothetical protein